MEREKALQKRYADLQNQIKELQEQYKSQQEMIIAQIERSDANNEEVTSTTNGEEAIVEDNISPNENE